MINSGRMWQGFTLVLALLVTVAFGRIAAAQTVETSFGSTDVAVDPDLLSALIGLGVNVEPIGAASLSQVTDDAGATSTVASFPVEIGAVNTDPAATALDLLHAGGLKLSVGDNSAELSDFVYNTNTALLSGRAVSQSGGAVTDFTRAPLFDLALTADTVVDAPTTTGLGILQISNVELRLTQEAIDFLEGALGADTGLSEGAIFGTANVATVIQQ